MVFYIKAVEIKSKIVKIKLFCIVLCLCVFMACEKYEPVISDEPVIPPTDQPKEPQEPISTDGIINWNNEFIIVGDNNMANIGSNDWNAVTYGNGRYVTVGDSNSAACSIDGINWTATSGFNDLSGICYGNGKFIAVGTGGNVRYSDDGGGWSTVTIPGKTNLRAVCYENGKFVAVGENGVIAYSTDGSSWTAKKVGSNDWNSVCYGNGKFVAVENDGEESSYSKRKI